MKRRIRTYAEVAELAGASLADQVNAQHARLHARLASIRSIIAVASGKGGVGKSFVAAQLAATLAARGQRVGALDADLNGPSLAAMLAAARTPLRVDDDGVHPATGRNGCRVMSSDLLLAEPDSPLLWRGNDAGAFVRQSALETGMLREFLSDVVWGELDVLIIDLPPGTDRIGRLFELVPPRREVSEDDLTGSDAGALAGILMVTTPSRAASGVVARALTYVRDVAVPHVGIVVNMDHHVCTACGTVAPLFATGASSAVNDSHRNDQRNASARLRDDVRDGDSASHNHDVWARLPFDPAAADATDRGAPLPDDAPLTAAFHALADRVAREIAPAARVSP